MPLQTLSYETNPASVIAALEGDGAVIVQNALPKDRLERLNDDITPLLATTENCQGIFHGFQTKRVGGMIGKSLVCQDMALDPIALAVMDHFLQPHCDCYQINLSQLIAIGPNERQQIIHADDPMFPHHFPFEIMINVMWTLDDFTNENGATHIAPGSHHWPRDRQPTDHEIIQAQAPKGSFLIWLGSVRHGGGANNTQTPRRGIVISYSLGWLRQSENQYLALPLETVAAFPEPLQKLAGFTVHKPNLGMLNGQDPLSLFRPSDQPRSSGFRDFMPDHIQDLLNQYYGGHNVMVA